MLQLTKEFSDALCLQLLELRKVLGPLKGFQEQERQTTHNFATLMITFGVFECYPPVLDEHFQDDIVEIINHARSLSENYSTVEVVWKSRPRLNEYIIQLTRYPVSL